MATRVDTGDLDRFTDRIAAWAARRESRVVCAVNVHSVVLASRDVRIAAALNEADANLPDGWPVAWTVGKLTGRPQARVSGPDLMWSLAGRAARDGIGLYLYGSRPEVLLALRDRLQSAFPELRIAGMRSPPFREPVPAADGLDIESLHASGAGLVLVGLGCPKQELWMAAHRGRIRAVMVGVGAAFDFHAGTVRRAPGWMQRSGMEWLFRLSREPRRLAGRYVDTNPRFLLWLGSRLLTGRLRPGSRPSGKSGDPQGR